MEQSYCRKIITTNARIPRTAINTALVKGNTPPLGSRLLVAPVTGIPPHAAAGVAEKMAQLLPLRLVL